MEIMKIKDFQHAKKQSFSSKILARGAEAILIHKDNELLKRRISKSYRHEELDTKIRIRRTKREAKLLEKASKIIPIPHILNVDEKTAEIEMEFIAGKKLSEYLDSFPEKEAINICTLIGKNTALLHNADIIHGDLTTSNMILHKEKVCFIDFGLGFHSKRAEDKAVDLHLLRQALESKHFPHWQEYFHAILSEYKERSKDPEKILAQLKKVESRGRYKGKYDHKTQPMVV